MNLFLLYRKLELQQMRLCKIFLSKIYIFPVLQCPISKLLIFANSTSNFKYLSYFSKYIVLDAKLAPVVDILLLENVLLMYLDIILVLPTPN